jgi:hypothetical protein
VGLLVKQVKNLSSKPEFGKLPFDMRSTLFRATQDDFPGIPSSCERSEKRIEGCASELSNSGCYVLSKPVIIANSEKNL